MFDDYFDSFERVTNNKRHTDLDKILKTLHNDREIENFIRKNSDILSDEEKKYLNSKEHLNMKTTKQLNFTKGRYSSKRLALHKKIVKHFVSKGAKSKTPSVIFMAGLGGSGKGTIKSPVIKELGLGSRIVDVDADEIKKLLPEYKPTNKLSRAMATHNESSDIAKKIVFMAINLKYNLVIDGTMKNIVKAKKIINAAKRKGYRTILRATQLPTHKAMERNVARYKGAKDKGKEARIVPLEIIDKMGKSVNKAIYSLKHDFDDFALYNTDIPKGKKPQLIERSVKK